MKVLFRLPVFKDWRFVFDLFSFLVMARRMTIIIPRWAFSSVGRALPSQGRGRRFESGKVHHLECLM